MINSAIYSIKQAFIQILRNKNMSSASVFSITAMMIILGMFFILVVNVNLLAQTAKIQFDNIQIYLLDEITTQQTNSLMKNIEKMDNVSEVRYISKEDALKEMQIRWGDSGYLLEGLPENPFPSSLEVQISDLSQADRLVEAIRGQEGIEDIKYYKVVVDKILSITSFIQTGALILIIILVMVSIIVVSNTIKLTVHARSQEISIMKYIGANNWFIRGPFLVEGILIGILSSLIAAGIIGFGYYQIMGQFAPKALVMFSIGMVPFDFIMKNLIVIFIALGISIGSLGSILSMRKFLDT